ncbi:phosphodiesterase [Arenibaculum pallidiluteum]|uniref:phosphodiesterase n=1 Tax=Arenibaculum pallidiluteum TaxID=2812559 RepID=UPI001A966801|nr:phosphodiesterase [Arenibaculum pallidiluteum]
MLIAHLSDCHVRPSGDDYMGEVDTGAALAAALAEIAARSPVPDVVVLGGDLVDAGTETEYERLAGILASLRQPVFAIPGNHDRRALLLATFAAQGWPLELDGFVQYAVEDWPLRMLFLDTLAPGRVEGELCEARLDWLERKLAEAPDRPTLVFMHHPPFAVGVDYMDAWNLRRGAERLAAILAANPQVERLLCGHLHRSVQLRWAGTLAVVAPSTAHQINLDLRPDPPMAYRLEPPGYLLHALLPGGGLVTHLVPVGKFGPARSFRDGAPVA